MAEALVKLYVQVIVVVIFSVVYLIFVKKKKRWIKWEKLSLDVQQTVKRNEKKINRGITIFFAISLLFMYIVRVVPAIMDIPNVVYDNYLMAEGRVVSWDYSRENKIEERSITILDSKTKKEVTVIVYSYGIREGDYIEVMYLPHSKLGTI